MDEDDENENKETAHDRRKQYNVMRDKGMTDKEATEKVWPTTTAGMNRNVKERADRAQKKIDDAEK